MAAAAAESFLSMSPLATNDPYVINVLLAYVLRRYLGLYVLVGRVVEDWRCLECEPDEEEEEEEAFCVHRRRRCLQVWTQNNDVIV